MQSVQVSQQVLQLGVLLCLWSSLLLQLSLPSSARGGATRRAALYLLMRRMCTMKLYTQTMYKCSPAQHTSLLTLYSEAECLHSYTDILFPHFAHDSCVSLYVCVPARSHALCIWMSKVHIAYTIEFLWNPFYEVWLITWSEAKGSTWHDCVREERLRSSSHIHAGSVHNVLEHEACSLARNGLHVYLWVYSCIFIIWYGHMHCGGECVHVHVCICVYIHPSSIDEHCDHCIYPSAFWQNCF